MSEILIAMGIIAIILTMSAPMMQTAKDNAPKKAAFRETIDILYQVMKIGMMDDELDRTTFGSYFIEHVNAVKTCPTNAMTGECWYDNPQNDAANAPFQQWTNPGLVLATGVQVGNLDNAVLGAGNQMYHDVIIDWNGVEEPNLIGRDQLVLTLCFGYDTCTPANTTPFKPETLAPAQDLNAAGFYPKNKTLYQAIYDDN